MRGVSVVRGATRILTGIDWELPRGATATILGPNGSGKTTLTRVITGYEWPSAGAVHVLGHKLGEVDVRQLRRDVQIVNPSAKFGLSPKLTALDAVLTGYFATLALYDEVTEAQRERAAQLLQAVGMANRIDHAYGTLSTGEQRRCLIARALVHLPKMLILDEPTAGLDIAAREHLLATITQLHQLPDGPTIINVTHHVEEVSPSTDQVVLLRGGRITAAGPPERVITPETLSDLYGCKVYVQKRSGRYWLEVLPEAWLDLLRDG